jgi:D-lactate dehydrogenase
VLLVPLLAPDPTRIGRPDSGPYDDRAPEWVAEGTPEPLRSDLTSLLGADKVLARAIDLVRFASDASPYRRLPRAVVMAHDADDVSAVFGYGRRTGTPVTLRSGGTSLNGQSQTDGILVDVRRHWAGVKVEEDATRVRARPGTVLGHVNRVLAPHRRRLGPDPASTDIATVGGVIANNSGGMRCGVVRDSYKTVSSMTFVLPSGTTVDTAEPEAESRFAEAEPELARGLVEIRDEIRADSELAERIARKFEIKNTTGYRLCAFLDADTPLEIFRRLLVGSEGTLAFIAEAVFDTVPIPACTTLSWLHFPSIDAATAPVGRLVEAGATAVELMVAPALMVASHNIRGTPEDWRELPPESAALLVEFGADTAGELDRLEATALELLADDELIRDPDFTRDPERIEINWHVREGMHGLVGRLRPPETALIIEDVCVPPARVADAARDIQALLGEHGFLTGVAGHVSAGNWHFMLTPNFAEASDRDRYESFMGKLVELIVDRYDGSLKAEHGTGVNMAPFVEKEWGKRATELMWRVKELADPEGVLSPGVVLNRDPGVHMRHLHSTPPIEEEATACVECGFCEPACPSRNVTTTPRQRIVIRREMARQPEGSPVLETLFREYEYDGIQTCAADGSCQPACPVAIDTGKLIKRFRALEHTERDETIGLNLARKWATVERNARAGLRAGGVASRVAGNGPVRGASRVLRRMLGSELVPEWPDGMPRAAPGVLPDTTRDGAAAVYIPACINRIFGNSRDAPAGPTLPEALVAVSARAGLPVWIPDDAAGHCCATPWSSKGYRRGNEHMARKMADAMWRWSGEGELPVVIDATSCAHGLVEDLPSQLADDDRERYERIEVLDSIAWAHDRLLPDLDVWRKVSTVAVHPTCSARHLDLVPKLTAVAGALAEHVVVPPGASCCGFAGDRGLLHPELPPSALHEEAAELEGLDLDACLCSNRTCEIGLHQVTGRPFASFVFLLEELTRPAAQDGPSAEREASVTA